MIRTAKKHTTMSRPLLQTVPCYKPYRHDPSPPPATNGTAQIVVRGAGTVCSMVGMFSEGDGLRGGMDRGGTVCSRNF